VRGQLHATTALYTGKEPVPIVQEAVWAPGPVWTAAESLVPTGIRSPDRPARSESLYRLRYPAHYALYTGKEPVPIVQEAVWAPGPVWTAAESVVPTAIRSPDRPARSESLYRLSYPAH